MWRVFVQGVYNNMSSLQPAPDSWGGLHGQSTKHLPEAQDQAARRPWVLCRPFGSPPPARWAKTPRSLPDLRSRPHGQSTRRISGSQKRAARPPGCAAAFRILGAGRTIRAPGGSPEPRSGQLAGPGCAVGLPGSSPPARWAKTPGSLPDLRRLPHGQNTRRISGSQERAARPPGCAAAFRILGVSSTVIPPREIPEGRERTTRPPGCAAVFRILDAVHTVRDTREPTGSLTSVAQPEHQASPRSPGPGSSPFWVCCNFLDPRRRPGWQRRQGTFRIFGAGHTVRAPGGSLDPRSGQLAGLDALQPPGSSMPPARSETPGSPPDPRYLPHGQEHPSGSLMPRSGQLAGPGCAADLPGSSTSAARSEHQADLRSPGAGSSRALGVLQAFPDPRLRALNQRR